MKKVYLDQNAASCLATSSLESEWGQIRSSLGQGLRNGSVVCPMPEETLVESARCTRDTRIAIDRLFAELSGGIAFKDFTTMLIESTLVLARNGEWPCPYSILMGEWGHNDEAASIVAACHDATRNRMTERQQQLARTDDRAGLSRDEVFRNVSLERCGMFWRDLEKYETDPNYPQSSFEIPWLIKGLQDHGLTVVEAARLREKVSCHDWEAIPENYFDLRLGSRWEHERICGYRSVYKANDEIDRRRAAVALVNANLFITDGYWAQLCNHADISGVSDTFVYSVKQVSRISEWCGKILNG